ncbi:hypothetical protein AB2B41_11930 [Marimonas sp. MJW-29]|uniref:VPLPA-CTERM protein sorting domain-containing protein n=1 Tax=Sulfitobacter sediminis TaxID=3234186 RepID=A0ABV3RPP2_9RHOB
MKKFTTLAFIGGFSMVAGAAMSASVTIDDFTAGGQIASAATNVGDPTPQKDGNTILVGNVLGGSRGLAVITNPARVTGTPTDINNASLEVDPTSSATDIVTGNTVTGIISFNNNSNQTSTGVLVYSGAGASVVEPDIQDTTPADNLADFTVDTTAPFSPTPTAAELGITTFGLNADITGGNSANNRFFFDVLSADLNVNIGIYGYDTAGNLAAAYGEDLIGGFSEYAAFNEFTYFGGYNTNFWSSTALGALAFVVQNDPLSPVDAVLGSISVVPLPASALLLLGGLGGLGFMSGAKRRRRKVA